MEEIEAVNEATQRQEENGSGENGNKIGDLVNEITKKLETLDPPLTRNCCIYRVPNEIREQNQAAYSPHVISIGPFHNGDKRLESMEKLKMRYLQCFLSRGRVALLEDFIQFLKQKENIIRSHYAETVQQSSDGFVKMILIDSCFIFEYFFRLSGTCSWSEEDDVLLKPWLKTLISQDLILLENQIPFSILEGLFNLTLRSQSSPQQSRFRVLTLCFFSFINPSVIHPIGPPQFKHFTDLLRMCYLPSIDQQLQDIQREVVKRLPSATELLESGMEFRVNRQDLPSLQFEKGVLKMSCFIVDDGTEKRIRNLMALEQCHYPYESYVTEYMLVLDFLINTSKDVDVLVRKGIIISGLGDSNAVAIMVNNICKGVTISGMSSHYHKTCHDVNVFYNDHCHKWKEILRRDYFSTPWKISGTIAAIVLLFLTLIQTICSVISVAH